MADDRLHVVLVGNYAPDGQASMTRFATLMRDGLAARGVRVTPVQPRVVAAGRRAAAHGAGKWLGYVDKLLLFPPALRRAAREEPGERLVVHICDHSNAVYVPWVRHVSHVVTCHDLLAVRSARGEFDATRTRWSGRVLQAGIVSGLRGAGAIVCDSEATRADVRRIVRDTAHVGRIHPGVSGAFTPKAGAAAAPEVRAFASGGRPYILHVGGNQWYKHRAGVVAIYRRLVADLADPPLLVFAGRPVSTDLRATITRAGLGARVHDIPDLTDADLAALYSSAALLLFPSLAEGFGWPVLEAMACGCRVVASGRAPLTEIAGDAATFVDPTDIPGAAATVAHVLDESPAARAEYVAAGLARASRFGVDRMIDGYLRVYRALLAGQPLEHVARPHDTDDATAAPHERRAAASA